jgi:hypothetical protein
MIQAPGHKFCFQQSFIFFQFSDENEKLRADLHQTLAVAQAGRGSGGDPQTLLHCPGDNVIKLFYSFMTVRPVANIIKLF